MDAQLDQRTGNAVPSDTTDLTQEAEESAPSILESGNSGLSPSIFADSEMSRAVSDTRLMVNKSTTYTTTARSPSKRRKVTPFPDNGNAWPRPAERLAGVDTDPVLASIPFVQIESRRAKRGDIADWQYLAHLPLTEPTPKPPSLTAFEHKLGRTVLDLAKVLFQNPTRYAYVCNPLPNWRLFASPATYGPTYTAAEFHASIWIYYLKRVHAVALLLGEGCTFRGECVSKTDDAFRVFVDALLSDFEHHVHWGHLLLTDDIPFRARTVMVEGAGMKRAWAIWKGMPMKFSVFNKDKEYRVALVHFTDVPAGPTKGAWEVEYEFRERESSLPERFKNAAYGPEG